GASGLRSGLFLAGAAYLSVALFPFLKIPANPPGVGDPETITFRQLLYMASLVLAVLGTMLAIALARLRASSWRWACAFLVLYAVVVALVLPNNPDTIELPADVVWTFRALSIAGLTLFWAVLGLTFGLVLHLQEARFGLRTRPSPA